MLGPLILFSAAMAFTPGPNIIMVTASGANFGFRRTIPAMLGVTLGFGSLIAAIGLGFAGLVQTFPWVHTVLKYAGAAYLLYLAWRIATAGDAATDSGRGRPLTVWQAALFQWINVKAWVAGIGAFAAFTTVGGDVGWEVAVITTVLTLNGLAAVAVWAAFGTLIGRFLGTPQARRVFNYVMAGLLVLSLIPVFW